jgi:hypothetical protein
VRRPFDRRDELGIEFAWNELTGAIGDSVTVVPIVVTVAVLTDLSLAVMLVWFGVFQIVWGLYYGVPISIEPMKALAALVIAGSIATGELLLAGLLLGGGLLVLGGTGSLERLGRYIGTPVVRAIQFGVALVLLETALRLGAANLRLAGVAVAVALGFIAVGSQNLGAFAVLVFGSAVAVLQTGVPAPTVPPVPSGFVQFDSLSLTAGTVEAALGQFAMTVGNAALAASVLLGDYFDRDISPDDLSISMGVMNLAAVPFGALPMCHGSGGIAGKYAFGARTAGANVILGVAYLTVALLAVGMVTAYPISVLGVILALVAAQLGWTSLSEASSRLFVVAIGALGLVVNLAAAFLAGIVISLCIRRLRGGAIP